MYKRVEERVGERHGRLLITGVSDTKKWNNQLLNVVCDCGVEKEMPYGNFLKTESCGCYHREIMIEKCGTHGHTSSVYPLEGYREASEVTPTYLSWQCMRQKSHNTGMPILEPRWEDFSLFLEDMGLRPEGGRLCRGDLEYGWDMDNCYWGDSHRRKIETK